METLNIIVKTAGAPAEKLNSAIESVKAVCSETKFNFSDSYGDCRLEIKYPDKTPKNIREEILRIVVSNLNEHIYALEDISLAERLVYLLKLRKMKISVAESFTGGGVGFRLVEIPGVSEVYFEGLNTYSNESKISRLGVNKSTLNKYGAVSEQTAYEMAEGLLKDGNCDIGIATTGIAGPGSDNTNKPVGLAYIAISTHEHVYVYKYNLKGNRKAITQTAVNLALFLAYKTIQ